ncbi:right-handed parallel beta-helix repeat-containing protein [Puniceicoccus vermicola]|uniref:Right-handed parallel beta-helix repeat-containing protein n=1 Tax=Puniceicoccus vermicola TaxID=388746 RepID=A0A7X1B0A8_9BACT|nr:right-handed parallel beta-helix repeat-containing protein [Puniceicoccus vermicola]MBC2603224.1 right-handed parallel beta-helix repeat-containing protein [Puniceicoccus vermicola]
MKVNALYGRQGPLPRARGEALKPNRLPIDEETLAQYGPDGPNAIRPRMYHEGTTLFHDRFGFSKGAITPAADLDEAEFLIIPMHQWTMNILPMERIDFDKQIVHLGVPCTYPIGVPHCAPEGSIWLENSLSVMQPGSWVYHEKRGRLYYCPDDDEPGADLEAACLTEFIRIEGVHELDGEQHPVKGVHFRNLAFTRSNRFAFHGLTGKGIQHDWEMHDAPSSMVRLRHAQNCSVTDCHFHQGASGGLRMDLACRGNRVERCEFDHLGGCGVVLCGYGLSHHYLNRENHVVDSHFHHLGEAYWHCSAIFIWQSGDNHIARNYVHDLPYTGIICSGRTVYDRAGKGECSATIHWDDVERQCGKGYVNNAWYHSGLTNWWMREPLMHSRENLIEYNNIHDVMQIMGDGNGIYVSGAGGGNVVRFNVVGPCPSPTMAEGIRCDDDQHQTILHGNLIFSLHGYATGIALKGVNRVTNNILALPLKAPVRGLLSLETGPLNGSVIRRNILLTVMPDHRFVGEIRIHGQGRKARLCDTDSDENIYWCSGTPEASQSWLDGLQSYGVDLHSRSCDPGFMDAENGDFSLKNNAEALELGFQALPLEKMFASQTQAPRFAFRPDT